MTITQNLSAPLVAVVGATGQQGGSVIKALSESDKPYRVRGFTRDVGKPAAQDLIKRGVEMVSADVNSGNDKQVYEGFSGATYAFAMTSPEYPFIKEKEFAAGKLFVDAAQAANVKLLVWAGLPSIAEASGGKYIGVSAFEAKAEVTKYAKESGIPFVNVIPAGYFSNYVGMMPPKKQADGTYLLTGVESPSTGQYLLDTAHDYGLFVRKAIEAPGMAGSEIHAFTEIISNEEVAKQLGGGTGKTIKYVQITGDQFMAAMPFPDETLKQAFRDMWLWAEEFGFYGSTSPEPVEEGLARTPRTFVEFVKATDWSQILK